MQDRLNGSLGHNLHRIGQLMREETAQALSAYEVTPEQWQLLVALAHTDKMTPKELGEQTLRDKTTISRILPGLEKKGLVVREVHPTDARSYYIRVPEEGKTMVEKSMEAVRDHFQQNVFTCLREEEQDRLLVLIHKLRAHLGDE